MNTDDRALADLIERMIDLITERDIRLAYEHFQHYAPSPCSASALRSAFLLLLGGMPDRLEAFQAKPVVGESSGFPTIGENWSTAGRVELPLAMGPRLSDAAKERLRKLEELDTVALIEACKYPMGGRFLYHDEEGEHDPAYVVIPGGEMVPINGYDDGDAPIPTDVARAAFIVTACNAALQSPPPVVSGEAKKPSHLSVIPVKGHPEKHAVYDAIMGDAIAVCPDEIAAQMVFDALTKADTPPVVEEGRREAMARIIEEARAETVLAKTIGQASLEGFHSVVIRHAIDAMLAFAQHPEGWKEQIRPYLQHRLPCRMNFRMGARECTCGLSAMLDVAPIPGEE